MRTIFSKSGIGALAVVVLAALAAVPPPAPAVAQTIARVTAAALDPSTVRAVQEALTKQGVAVTVDGVLGAATRAAIRAYQTQHHLPVTGEPDAATLEKLGVAAGAPGRQAQAPQGARTPMGDMMGSGMMGSGTMGSDTMSHMSHMMQMMGGQGGGMMGGQMGAMGRGTGMSSGTMMGMGRMHGLSAEPMGMMAGLIYGMPNGEMTTERVSKIVDGLLAWHGNPRLKLGAVAEDGGAIVAEIVTQDGSLVQKLAFNRYPGVIRQVP